MVKKKNLQLNKLLFFHILLNWSVKRPTTIVLECILALLTSVPTIHLQNIPRFTDFLWQDLCPTLIIVLGSPLTDKNIVSSQPFKNPKGTGSMEELGRGSSCLTATSGFHSFQARTVYRLEFLLSFLDSVLAWNGHILRWIRYVVLLVGYSWIAF